MMEEMSLLERLKHGRDAVATVTVNGVDIGLRILTEQDYQIAHMAAAVMLAEHETDFSMATADAFEAEKALQLIALSAIDPATKKPVFSSPDEARAVLMRGDRDLISEKYLIHERAFSPSGRNLTDSEFTALLEDVKKNPEKALLSDLSIDTLKRLITTLAVQLFESQKESGSSS